MPLWVPGRLYEYEVLKVVERVDPQEETPPSLVSRTCPCSTPLVTTWHTANDGSCKLVSNFNLDQFIQIRRTAPSIFFFYTLSRPRPPVGFDLSTPGRNKPNFFF